MEMEMEEEGPGGVALAERQQKRERNAVSKTRTAMPSGRSTDWAWSRREEPDVHFQAESIQ